MNLRIYLLIVILSLTIIGVRSPGSSSPRNPSTEQLNSAVSTETEEVTGKTYQVGVDANGNPLPGLIWPAVGSPTVSLDANVVLFRHFLEKPFEDDVFAVMAQIYNQGVPTAGDVITIVEDANYYESSSISADGRFVAYSYSHPVHTFSYDIYLYDRDNPSATKITEGANNTSTRPSLSANGRYVAFYSQASNLVADDDNGKPDIFVYDRTTGKIALVSRNSSGEIADEGAGPLLAISADGLHIAYSSGSTNLDELVPSPPYPWAYKTTLNSDLSVKKTEGISIAPDGSVLDIQQDPAISGDGRYVAFSSNSDRIYVRDTVCQDTTLISLGLDGLPSTSAQEPQISADGRFVVFNSFDNDLVENDVNECSNNTGNCPDVFIHDYLGDRSTQLISVTPMGGSGNSGSWSAGISPDGRTVYFRSSATDLIENQVSQHLAFLRRLPPVDPIPDRACPVKLAGRAIDRNGGPIAGVTVSVGPGQDTLTQNDGTFELRLAPGLYVVTVAKSGYSFTPTSQTVELTQDSNLGDFIGVLNTPLVDPIDNSDGDGTFVVRWSNVVNASQYELHEIGISGTSQQIYVGPSRSYTVTDKGYGTWCYKVRAIGPNESQSEWSTLSCIEIPPCVPYFSQEDPRWADHPLRTAGAGGCSESCNTIGACGCTLTAATMLFAYYGADLTPNALSDTMGTQACPFSWNAGAAATNGKATYIPKKRFAWLHLDNELNQNGRPVILGMSKGANTHWVLVTSGQGEEPANYLIHDPWPKNGPDTSLDVYRKQGWSFNSLVSYDGVGVCRPAPTITLHINLPNNVQSRTESNTASSRPSALRRGNVTEQGSITGSIAVYHLNVDTAVVQLQASSENASIAEMQVWTDSQTSPQWQPYDILAWIPWEAEDSTVYTRFRDNEGNTSQVFQASMWPLIGPPSEAEPENQTLNLLPAIFNR